MFEPLRHLLPDSTAWRVIADRLLRKYLVGLSSVGTDVRAFTDDVSDDLWPATTRELEEWEEQFGLYGLGSEAARRATLDAAWKATGGQSPGYIQTVMQAAGFDVYVHDWWNWTVALATLDAGTFPAIVFAGYKGFTFSNDGFRMYLVSGSSDWVERWELATAWDPSSAGPAPTEALSVASEEVFPQDVAFNYDGTRIYVLGVANGVSRYDLLEPWTLTGGTYIDRLSVQFDEATPTGVLFSADGARVQVVGASSATVHQWDLSTPWDLATATYDIGVNVSAVDTSPVSLAWAHHGNTLLVLGTTANVALQYTLAAPYDITGMTIKAAKVITPDENAAVAIATGKNGRKLYVHGTENNDLITYSFDPTPINPQDYTDQPTRGTTQCGELESLPGRDPSTPIAECGEQPPGQTSLASAVCNSFLANEIHYLWNDDLSQQAPPDVPDDPLTWPHFIYVGGETFPDTASIDTADRARFEELLYKLCPTEKWIVTLTSFEEFVSLGEYQWDSSTAQGADENVRLNNVLTSATRVRVGEQNADAVAKDAFLSVLTTGDKVRVANLISPETDYVQWEITDPAVHGAGFYGLWVLPAGLTYGPGWTTFPADTERMIVSVYDA